jgi:hypothetical protein
MSVSRHIVAAGALLTSGRDGLCAEIFCGRAHPFRRATGAPERCSTRRCGFAPAPFHRDGSYITGSNTIAQLNEDGAEILSITGGTLAVAGTTFIEGSLAVGAGARLHGALSVGGSLSVIGQTVVMSAATTSTIGAPVCSGGRAESHWGGELHRHHQSQPGNVTIAAALSDGAAVNCPGPTVMN